jgi:aminoglycoside 6'-N-acetyltransferase
MAALGYHFRPLSVADLPLVRRWLDYPHVSEWWGDPMRGLANITDHFGDPTIDMFMVTYRGVPLGYQQCYDPHAEAGHPLRDQPVGTRGIDQFIGEPDFVGRGHGSAFIRAFVERLFDTGAPRVVTDPDPRNARAIRAYAKAGFHPIGDRVTLSGDALLMACDARTMNV